MLVPGEEGAAGCVSIHIDPTTVSLLQSGFVQGATVPQTEELAFVVTLLRTVSHWLAPDRAHRVG